MEERRAWPKIRMMTLNLKGAIMIVGSGRQDKPNDLVSGQLKQGL